MPTPTRILVPVDFSPCSKTALDYAARLAQQMKATVDVLHVHEPAPPGTLLNVPMQLAPMPAWDETRADVRRELESFIGPERPCVREVRVERGAPTDVIADAARDGGFDLVVMGQGRGGASRPGGGGVAESVMRNAHVPVLTLRMPRREQRESIPF